MAQYEILGADELAMIGDDDIGAENLDDVLSGYELIGARKRAAMQRRAPARPAQRPMPRPGQVTVRETQPSKAGRLYLPMKSVSTVAAAASETITGRPQSVAFKPQRIVVPATVAPDFTIDSIVVGVKPQGVQTGSVSAETFVADAVDCEMDMDTVQGGLDFVLAVTNISGAARTFRATVYGRSIST